jgi:hypothetical protein
MDLYLYVLTECVSYKIYKAEKQYFPEMDHIVTLNSEAHEIENLLQGTKSMIIHGSDVKCYPYGLVSEGDVLYFVSSNRSSEVKAKAVASSVYNSCLLSVEESFEMIIRNQDKLVLPDDLFYNYAGKKYLVLIGLSNIEKVKPFRINRITSKKKDEWYTVRA